MRKRAKFKRDNQTNKSVISQIYGEKIFKSKKILGNIQKSQEKLQTIMMMFALQKLIVSYLMFMKF